MTSMDRIGRATAAGMLVVLLFLVTLSTPRSAHAQTVYRCAGPNGVPVFSQDPCGKDAKLVMGDAKKKSKPDDVANDQGSPTGSTAATPAGKPEISNVQAISDSADDSTCRREAQKLLLIPSTAKIDDANRKIAELNTRHYENGFGRPYEGNAAIANQQVEQQIISLRQLISGEEFRNEQIRADSSRRITDALAECDRRKANIDRQRIAQ